MYIYTKKLMFLLLIPLLTAQGCSDLNCLKSREKAHSRQIVKHNQKTACKPSSAAGTKPKKELSKKDPTKNKQGIKDGALSKIKPTGQTQSTDAAMESDNSQDAQATPTIIQQDSTTSHGDDKDQHTNQHRQPTEGKKKKGVLTRIIDFFTGSSKQDNPKKDDNKDNMYEQIADDMQQTI
ncbi:hypothetical protein [Cardinium endosymbiont of Sogatella furcifera]|uniref:hypothetical protein n=1 Tax=Cardinium endosymbiont of Sogatella furcifera TaxID=650378 RepID=UPI000E0CDDF2|nr:hypothetical protein [Cardinium endosymbiont of Sogatella furcifera]